MAAVDAVVGYLDSECAHVSAEESGAASTDDDDVDVAVAARCRSYNVARNNSKSSATCCTSSNESVNADVAKPRKNRRFSKVFIVNREQRNNNNSNNNNYNNNYQTSSDDDDNQTLSSSDAQLEDSSDNDTDTERVDCGIVLNFVRAIDEQQQQQATTSGNVAAKSATSDEQQQQQQHELDVDVNVDVEREIDKFFTFANASDNSDIEDDVDADVDGDSSGIVLHAMRTINVDVVNEPKYVADTVEQQLMAPINVDNDNDNDVDACDQLHSITNDVNRMLALHKQNSELELKLQRLRRRVAEINEDHLLLTKEKVKEEERETVRESEREKVELNEIVVNEEAVAAMEVVAMEVVEEKEAAKQAPRQRRKWQKPATPATAQSTSRFAAQIEPTLCSKTEVAAVSSEQRRRRCWQRDESVAAPRPTSSSSSSSHSADADVDVDVDETQTTLAASQVNNNYGHLEVVRDSKLELIEAEPAASRPQTTNAHESASSLAAAATAAAVVVGQVVGAESVAHEMLNVADVQTNDFDEIFGGGYQTNKNNNKKIVTTIVDDGKRAQSPNSSLSAKYRSLIVITKSDNDNDDHDNNDDDDNVELSATTTTIKVDCAAASPTAPCCSPTPQSVSIVRVTAERDYVGGDEDGLADDDSWVEELSQHGGNGDEYEVATTTASEDDPDADGDEFEAAEYARAQMLLGRYLEHEEALRGYNRSAIDFTLHTIVEESCEESEVSSRADGETADDNRTLKQHHNRLSASELEKYFFYNIGDGKTSLNAHESRADGEAAAADEDEDTASELSSECSECADSLEPHEQTLEEQQNSELASSRLEKYFLSGFMGFNAGEHPNESDASGSVGSDSEGRPSPSQRRKRQLRARGTPRSHNSSLDNLLQDMPTAVEGGTNENADKTVDSSESECCDDTLLPSTERLASDGSSSDTLKRKKQPPRKRHDSLDDKKMLHESYEDVAKLASASAQEQRAPTPGAMASAQAKKQQHHSRDSGFVGSNDDLLKSPDNAELSTSGIVQTGNTVLSTLAQIAEVKESCNAEVSALAPAPELLVTDTQPTTATVPRITMEQSKSGLLPATHNSSLVRKDSFNNWSSDEETNLMLSKMRQFFKTLIAAKANAQSAGQSAARTLPDLCPLAESAAAKSKSRPAQLAYFENELTRLMKTVPGINDEQVREIVEYLSSEDTWSDSYDSSDYTSSDLEGSNQQHRRADYKAQISESCQQIIKKFDIEQANDVRAGVVGNVAVVQEQLLPTAQLTAAAAVAATRPAAVEDDQISNISGAERSPQLFAKVMQHIGAKLVALMHEVSSGNDTPSNSSPMLAPRCHQQHRKLQAKNSLHTTEDEEEQKQQQPRSASHKRRTKLEEAHNLERSKSHDLLLDSATTSVAANVCNVQHGNYAGPNGGHGTTPAGHQRPPHHHQSSGGVSEAAASEECGMASDYERYSWRGSFESALLANGDSRTKLSQLDRDNSSSASALAVAKRRSAGDLLFNYKSLSREQLDRVRSCGSIGGGDEHHQQLETSPARPWVSSSSCDSRDVRRSSISDAIYESETDSGEQQYEGAARSTLPRSLGNIAAQSAAATTNSLPRLPTTAAAGGGSCTLPMHTSTPKTKSQSALNFSSSNSAKSARYRSPGLAARAASSAKKTGTSLGLQHFLYSKRDARKRLNISAEEAKVAARDLSGSPVLGQRSDDASSPIHSRRSGGSNDSWPTQSDEDIDRLVAMHQNRASLSSLGVRSESMGSVYSGAGEGRYGTVVVKGQVEFGMQYNYKLGALEIHVVRCKDLAAVDTKRNRSDPYVKVYLLPDKSKAGKRKTKVKKHTLNPTFDEILRFQVPIASLEARTLWLTVWHSDMFGRNDFLGEVSLSLHGRVFDNPQSQLYMLQERSEPYDDIATYRGDIVVGLKYIPPQHVKSGSFTRGSSQMGGSAHGLRKFGGSIKAVASSKSERSSKGGQLHVLVKEAKHLNAIKSNGTCDAFCKSYLLPDRTRSSKQKTPVIKRSLNPSWSYTFVYEDVTREDLAERALELTVWDHDRLASNEFIGGVRFSLGTGKSCGRFVDWMDATGKELSLWQNMLDRPNFWVEGSLVLRSTLDGTRNSP